MDKALAADHFLCRSREHCQTMAGLGGAGTPVTQTNKNSSRGKFQARPASRGLGNKLSN